MNSFLDFLEGNSTLNLIFLILAILGIFFSIFFYLKSKKKKPVYSIQTNRLIKNNLSSLKRLKIYYSEVEIQNLSITKLAFWNAGKETIKKDDFINADSLRIEINNNFTIYDYEIESSNTKNNFRIKEKKNSLKINFDFIDKNQGIILKIYHNGIKSEDIQLKGSFIGSKHIQKSKEREKATILIFNSKLINFINENLDKGIWPVKIITFMFVALVMSPIMLLTILPVSLIDYIYDNFFNNSPKVFHFFDEEE